MSFLVEENSLSIRCSDNAFNIALLKSFLEEAPGEEYNHEELDCLMRSLEAEINLSKMDIQDSMMESESHGYESVDLDFQLGDLKPMPSTSPRHDMNYWHMDTQGEEVDALFEIRDEYKDINCFDDVLEGQMYTTSWIETDAIEMYS